MRPPKGRFYIILAVKISIYEIKKGAYAPLSWLEAFQLPNH